MPNPPQEPPYDPDYDPRLDPRDARYDPRLDPRYDPRGEQGGSYDPRDPRYDGRGDPGYDPRRGGPPPRQDYRDDPRYGAPPPPPYDRGRRDTPGVPPPPPTVAPRRRLPLWAILAGLLALVLVAFFAFGLTRDGPGQDRLDENGTSSAAADPEEAANERCGSQQTYDLIKRELFRRAAQVRGSDLAAFDRLSGYSTIRVTQPVLKRQDEGTGTLVCSGQVALDLPPGLGVVGGRRTLNAEMDYSLTGAADRSGDVVTLAGADPIVVPLATLARTGAQPAEQETDAGAAIDSTDTEESVPAAPVPAPSVPVAPSPPQRPEDSSEAAPAPITPPQTARVNPSFNCSNARTRSELAVCRNGGLASLDRQMSGAFFSALREATPEQRALLQRTRNRFLSFRDRCTSDACIAGAYRDRIREINDIANDRWQP